MEAELDTTQLSHADATATCRHRRPSCPQRSLPAVGPEEVVQLVEAGDGWLVIEGAVWSSGVVPIQPAGEGGAVLLA
jgi:hypothetical protein